MFTKKKENKKAEEKKPIDIGVIGEIGGNWRLKKCLTLKEITDFLNGVEKAGYEVDKFDVEFRGAGTAWVVFVRLIKK